MDDSCINPPKKVSKPASPNREYSCLCNACQEQKPRSLPPHPKVPNESNNPSDDISAERKSHVSFFSNIATRFVSLIYKMTTGCAQGWRGHPVGLAQKHLQLVHLSVLRGQL